MKKKSRDKKKTSMPEFHFKEFTPEESRIYEEAVQKYREAVTAGKTLREAYETYAISDTELENLIQADFLKIMIAELHFARHQSLEEVAGALAVSPDLIKDVRARMLQEVGVTAAEHFGKEYGDGISKTND